MLAFTGWIVNGFGLHFPGMLSKADGVSFDTLAKMSPMDAWEAVPEFGRHQMGAVIFLEGRAPLHQVRQHVRPIELRGQDPGEGSGGTD